MSRVIFETSLEQVYFFQNVKLGSSDSWKKIAKTLNLNERTLYDWRSGKSNPDADAVLLLTKMSNVPIGKHKTVDDYWYVSKAAKLGGVARHKKYGDFGTIDGCRKGGIVSQKQRMENPEKYRKLGCNVRKKFGKLTHSEDLAEVLGILLGDGSLTDYQITVTLDATVDRQYAHFVQKLFSLVLGEKPSWSERDNVIELKLSGASLIDVLEDVGLERGNKVEHQVGIPDWIFKKREYQKACARGLFDTDGCIFQHRKLQKTYIGWTFTNYSLSLIGGMEKILQNFDFEPAKPKLTNLYMYSAKATVRYIDIIGSHNPKHTGKVLQYK
jgi:hypothetical protein